MALMRMLCIAVLGVAAGCAAGAEEAAEGYYPLFNGRDFDGWIVCPDAGGPAVVRDEALWLEGTARVRTASRQGNFVLRLEYTGAPRLAVQDGTGTATEIAMPEAADWQAAEFRREARAVEFSVAGGPAKRVPVSPGEASIMLGCSGAAGLRRMRLLPLPGGPGWRRLFNGRDLEGWTAIGDGAWTVLPGGIVRFDGRGMTKHSALRTTEEFSDFEVRLFVRAHGRANSGVFFRGRGARPWPRSYEAQIDNHADRFWTGAIYGQVPAVELRAGDNAWFEMRIRAEGPRIQVAVNGKVVTDMLSTRHSRYPSGWIALQGHDARSVVEFRDIEIRKLDTARAERSEPLRP